MIFCRIHVDSDNDDSSQTSLHSCYEIFGTRNEFGNESRLDASSMRSVLNNEAIAVDSIDM
jgi:hypothetical protein